MKFTIEQIAITPPDAQAAMDLLADMGAQEWVHDEVFASGQVMSVPSDSVAELHFNYDLGTPDGKLEFEVLDYTAGKNWMAAREALAPDRLARGENAPRITQHRVSHLGMHCSAEDLERWLEFFSERGYPIAQSVLTRQHENSAIAGKRWYRYVIFDTYAVLGVDLKFIVRRYAAPTDEDLETDCEG